MSFINLVLHFFLNALEILTIFYLSPEYILISQNFSKIIIFFTDEMIINIFVYYFSYYNFSV